MLTDCLLTLHSNLNRCTLEGLRCAGKSRGVWQSTRLELSSRAILYSASEPSREASEAVLTQRNKMSGNNNARFLVEGQGWYYWWQFCQSFYLCEATIRFVNFCDTTIKERVLGCEIHNWGLRV